MAPSQVEPIVGGTAPPPPPPAAPGIQQMTRQNPMPTAMANRMGELQGGCYAVSEAPCMQYFFLTRETNEAGEVTSMSACPACCLCCVPNCCPMGYTNKVGGVHGGWLQGTHTKGEFIAWDSPKTFIMFGPMEPKTGTPYRKCC